MSTTLIYASPFAGHLFPVIACGLALKARGHRVVLATGQRAVGVVAQAGLRGVLAFRYEADLVDARDADARGATTRSRTVAAADVDMGFGEAAAADLEALIDAEQPDVVLVDPMAWGASVAAEASGLPWVHTAHTCTLIPSLGARMLGPGLAPPTGPLSRWRQRLTALALRQQGDAQFLAPLNAVRAARGLRALRHVEDSMRRAPLTVAFTAEPFEYPRADWHPSVRFVGPALWEAPAAPPPWLGALDDRPLVLVCTSSAPQADEPIITSALAGLAAEPIQVVVTAPTGALPASVPPNAYVARYVAHGPLLARAACVVCHGGAGITQKALAAGVPVVVCPFGRDQFEVAERVVHAGVGVRVRPNELGAERVRLAVRSAIGRRSAAERLAATFRRAGGAAAAAAAVEELLST